MTEGDFLKHSGFISIEDIPKDVVCVRVKWLHETITVSVALWGFPGSDPLKGCRPLPEVQVALSRAHIPVPYSSHPYHRWKTQAKSPKQASCTQETQVSRRRRDERSQVIT
jgi:hypothetical protein